jgi:hypothetical protein
VSNVEETKLSSWFVKIGLSPDCLWLANQLGPEAKRLRPKGLVQLLPEF